MQSSCQKGAIALKPSSRLLLYICLMRFVWGLVGLSLLLAQKGVAGFGRVGIGGMYGAHLSGVSLRLPLGYAEYTFVEVHGGVGQSRAPYTTGLHKAIGLGMGMNQGILGGWLTRDCDIYWFLPYIDLGGRVYYHQKLPQPDGNGGTTEKDVWVPAGYAGIGVLFNVIRHVELFAAARAHAEIIENPPVSFDWQVGARVSFGY